MLFVFCVGAGQLNESLHVVIKPFGTLGIGKQDKTFRLFIDRDASPVGRQFFEDGFEFVTDSELEQRESRASFDGLGGTHQCFERAAGPQSL